MKDDKREINFKLKTTASSGLRFNFLKYLYCIMQLYKYVVKSRDWSQSRDRHAFSHSAPAMRFQGNPVVLRHFNRSRAFS